MLNVRGACGGNGYQRGTRSAKPGHVVWIVEGIEDLQTETDCQRSRLRSEVLSLQKTWKLVSVHQLWCRTSDRRQDDLSKNSIPHACDA